MKLTNPKHRINATLGTGLRAAALSAVVVAGVGCTMMGYTVGSTLPSDLRKIYVPTFENLSGEPQLEAPTTAAAIQEFQKDGTLRVVKTEAEADLVLTVKLSKFSLEPLRFDPNQEKKANEYRMLIDARLECVNRRAGTVLTSHSVQGKTDFIPSGGMTLSKRDAVPDASADLAHKIVKSVVEAW
jgi:hypothetical protein